MMTTRMCRAARARGVRWFRREMATFAERFGFHFAAHEIGDAIAGRVERPFWFNRNNFLAGRTSPVGRL